MLYFERLDNAMSRTSYGEIKFCEENFRQLIKNIDNLNMNLQSYLFEYERNFRVIDFLRYSIPEEIDFFESLYSQGIRDKKDIDIHFKNFNRKRKIKALLC